MGNFQQQKKKKKNTIKKRKEKQEERKPFKPDKITQIIGFTGK